MDFIYRIREQTLCTIIYFFLFLISAPLSVPHVAIEDVEIDGKIIPRDTIIIPHLMSVHLDPTVWDKPEEFRPERFLDKDGHFVKKEGFSAFSMGMSRALYVLV